MALIPPPPELKPGARVWAYLRDSGGEAQDQSVAQQQSAIARFCHTHGLTLDRVWADVARSGTTDAGREQFGAMMDALQSNPPTALLYWSSSRLARNEADAAYYRAVIRRAGVLIHSLTEHIPDGPFGAVIEAVLDVANAEQSRKNSTDVKRGLEALARAGFAVGGFPPRGYKAEPVTVGVKRNGQPRIVSRWVPDPDLWEFCKLAWQMRAAGESLRAIQEATENRIFSNRNCWCTFFRNRSYLGIGKCGAIEIPDHHPALVDLPTWEAVQARQRQKAIENHASFNRSPSLLSGLARCALCGGGVAKHTSGQKHWKSYLCTSNKNRGKAACPAVPVSQARVDAAIVDTVLTRILSADSAALLAAAQNQLNDHAALDAKLQRLERDVAGCERAIQNLLELAETFGAQSAGARLREREETRERLQAELAIARAHRAQSAVVLTPAVVDLVFQTLRTEIQNATTDVMALRQVIKSVITRVDIGKESLTIHYSYQAVSLAGVPPSLHTLQAYSLIVTLA
jgi:DNA invertase Pin-like site-specific DNA recombinase